jgi:hypothetical protein
VNETWVRAVASVAGGFAAGSVLAWAARGVLRGSHRRPELREIAVPVATFLFWLGVAGGIVLAVAAVEPRTIEDIPADILAYLPRVLAAGLILLAGRALGVATAAGTGRAVVRALGRPSAEIGTAVRWGVNLAAAVLALSQLGVDTTVLVVLAAGVAVSFGLSFALLVGLGGRQAAREIAAGRYLRRFVTPGSTLRSAGLAGSVVALHPLTMELLTEDGRRVHVPHSRLLGDVFEVDDDGGVSESGPTGPG